MADEDTTTDEPRGESDNGGEEEDKRPDDTLADSKTCPECGAPVDDVRATCINCGYEYGEGDHEDTEAGNEFLSGSQVDDEGNELPDQEPPEEDSSKNDSSEDDGP